MDDCLLHPQSPPSELSHHYVGRTNGLRKAGAFIKLAFYDDDIGERAYAHEVLDSVIDECIEQGNIIETLQLENDVLEDYLLDVMEDNKRLQIVCRMAMERLAFYEPVQSGDVKFAQTEGHYSILEDTNGNDSEFEIAQDETSIVDSGSFLMQHKIDGTISAMHTPTNSSEIGGGTERAAGTRPVDDNMREILPSIQPSHWQEVVRILHLMEQEAKEVSQETKAKITNFKAEMDHEETRALSKRVLELEDTQRTCNNLAARITFNNLNPCYYQVPNNTVGPNKTPSRGPEVNLKEIDLHNLTVQEARTHAWEHVLYCQIQGVKRTEIICGQGRHSKDSIPKLKPALLNALCQLVHVQVKVHEKNPGRLVVEMLDEHLASPHKDVVEANETLNTKDGV